MLVMHYILGNGVRCDYRFEAGNAVGEWEQVTCLRCLRHCAHDWERNGALWARYAEKGLPPISESPKWQARHPTATSKAGCQDLADEAYAMARATEAQIESVRAARQAKRDSR